MDMTTLETRTEYIDRIRRELLGPGSEIDIPDRKHELISVSPDVRYSVGVLYTRKTKMNADNNDTERAAESTDDASDDDAEDLENEGAPVESDRAEDDGKVSREDRLTEEDNLDEEVSLAAQNMPSSMGMTFFVEGDADRVVCDLKFATYRRAGTEDCYIPFYPPKPDEYTVPVQFSQYVEYIREKNCLHFLGVGEKKTGLSKKEIYAFRENGAFSEDETDIFDELLKLSTQAGNGYVRIPHEVEVVLEFTDSDYIDQNQGIDKTMAKVTALRRKLENGITSLTIMLVNDSELKSNGERCLFQPEIIVSTDKNDFVFRDYSGLEKFENLDDEEKSLVLQYRNKKAYGTGLGTSMYWEIDDSGKGYLKNDFFPKYEIPSMNFDLPEKYHVKPEALSMKYMSDLYEHEKSDKLELLRTVVNAYEQWISEQTDKVGSLDKQYKVIADKNIQGCIEAKVRMYEGIRILNNDPKALEAFELANRAMYMQRVHIKLQEKFAKIRECYPGDNELNDLIRDIEYREIDQQIKDKYSWRPFQIAFLLMSVESIVKDDSPDRSIVDLIWFPTGGGKTEAYLGLTAFTIFYRRLSHLDQSDGTAVIMRYTLRLLAAQQFTRASTLICACEFIRRDCLQKKPRYKKHDLGTKPITIGLWIGDKHTPNRNDKADDELKELLKATPYNLRDMKDRHNKFQVLKCPWCGTKLVKDADGKKMIGEFGYRMKTGRHFELFCPQDECFFGLGGLPVQVVDEELYLNPPTLLFGTVDKFAMLPWRKDIGAFFGVGKNNRTPELIIQDELHLISGPLGTMVGLYETAVDVLCESKGVKSKIIASTATIRRAKEQCSALYDRAVNQFPHPALDAEDSFFASEAPTKGENGKPGRMYVGLMPSGKTKAMMEVRTIAALMQTINIMDLPDDIKDRFWTLTVYFNSLKDLGKCHTLVEDDVKDFIKRMAFRTGTARDARMISRADELTSRVSTTELNETLDKLEKISYSKDNLESKRYPSNILLATNMISVGIDVARLNVMALVGQPKLTSEYIQASSRIGRSDPGVAFVLYDGSKSRDRSHYEQFRQYHQSIYRFVEPTGATPFSKPARDRALHAVVIALLRLLEPSLTDNPGAFEKSTYQQRIDYLKSIITKRNSEIIARSSLPMADDSIEIAEEIDVLLDRWENMSESYQSDHFSYGEKYLVKAPEDGFKRLMKVYNSDGYDTEPYETMTSMRNVDKTANGNILIWESVQ